MGCANKSMIVCNGAGVTMHCEPSQQNTVSSQELVYMGTVRKPMEEAINIAHF